MLDSIKERLEKELSGAIVGEDLNTSPVTLEIGPQHLIDACRLLHESPDFYFDHLASITGVDNGPDAGSMEVIYHLYSISMDQQLAIKVTLERKSPRVESVSGIWKAADWHEREAYDLLGIQFDNHPDLRRILLPDDWEGHPLRKDYVEQEMYHGVEVKWKKPDNELKMDS